MLGEHYEYYADMCNLGCTSTFHIQASVMLNTGNVGSLKVENDMHASYNKPLYM
jgi:hypothetical protein